MQTNLLSYKIFQTSNTKWLLNLFSEIFQIYADSRMGTIVISKSHQIHMRTWVIKKSEQTDFQNNNLSQVAMPKKFHKLQPLKTSNKLNQKFALTRKPIKKCWRLERDYANDSLQKISVLICTPLLQIGTSRNPRISKNPNLTNLFNSSTWSSNLPFSNPY